MTESRIEPQWGKADDLSGLFSRYRRHIPLVAGITLFCAIAAVGATFLMTPRYTAVASFEFSPAGALVLGPADGQLGPAQTLDQIVDTQAEVLQSPALAREVVRRLQLDRDPEFADLSAGRPQLDIVADNVMASQKSQRVGFTNLFRISFTDPNPVKAARIANAFVQIYADQQIERKRSQLQGGSTVVNSGLDELRRQVELADAAVQNYRVTHNYVSTTGTAVVEQEISSLNQQLAMARVQEAEATARLNTGRRQAASSTQGADVGAALDSPTISRLREQRSITSRSVAELASRYGERHPEVIKARDALNDLDLQIRQEVERIMSNLGAQASIARERRVSLEGSLARSQGALSAGSTAAVGLEDLQRTADAAREQLQAYTARSLQASSQQGAIQPDIQAVAPATPPIKPSSPSKKKNLLLGVVIGLGVGLFAAFIRHQWIVGLDTLDDVELQLNQAFLGSLPTVQSSIKRPGKTRPVDIVVAKPLSILTEAFRNLATSVLYSPTGDPHEIIGITSAMPGEGKTTASISLARMIAKSGLSTVVVDCDLRRRSLTELLLPRAQIGLIEVLEGVATLDAAIKLEEHTGLRILPLGPGSEQVEAPFASSLMDKLLDDLRERFDVVVLDTPPVLAVADTRVLAPKMDALVMLVRWRKTPAKAARAAIQMVESVGGHVTGVALSLVNLKAQADSRYGETGSYAYKMKGYYKS